MDTGLPPSISSSKFNIVASLPSVSSHHTLAAIAPRPSATGLILAASSCSRASCNLGLARPSPCPSEGWNCRFVWPGRRLPHVPDLFTMCLSTWLSLADKGLYGLVLWNLETSSSAVAPCEPIQLAAHAPLHRFHRCKVRWSVFFSARSPTTPERSPTDQNPNS